MCREDQILKTEYINDEISCCETIDELKELIDNNLKEQSEMWKREFGKILKESNLTVTEFAKKIGKSRQTVYNWTAGEIPKERETFIKAGLLAGYDKDQMNRLLQRQGRFRGLYSKNIDDCVCMYVVDHDYGDDALKQYNEIKDRIFKEVEGEGEDIKTELFDRKVSEIASEDELEKFIKESGAVFATEYNKLYSFILMDIEANFEAENINELASIWNCSSSLKKSLYEIRKKKWKPIRDKVISIGMHMLYKRKEIDDLLKMAHMEPLYAKNIFDSVIIFILEDASLQNLLNKGNNDSTMDDFYDYVRDILKEIDNNEIKGFMDEFLEVEE